MASKSVQNSIVIMHELVLPNDTNVLGNILGGRVMHYMDICAAMSAYKHARSPVVTASVDRLNFLAPAKMGDILILKSSVNYTGNTSMEVGVRIESENPISGEINHTASAYLTFVSLDDNRKPKAVEKINPESFDEIRRLKDAERRKEIRKNRLKEFSK
jgi:acyl-CoA hydrolase